MYAKILPHRFIDAYFKIILGNRNTPKRCQTRSKTQILENKCLELSKWPFHTRFPNLYFHNDFSRNYTCKLCSKPPKNHSKQWDDVNPEKDWLPCRVSQLLPGSCTILDLSYRSCLRNNDYVRSQQSTTLDKTLEKLCLIYRGQLRHKLHHSLSPISMLWGGGGI